MDPKMNIDQDIRINKYQLEIECEKQAAIYHPWAAELATAKTELDGAENFLKFTQADQELKIRQAWSETDGKITEALVKAKVETSNEVLKARNAIHEANKIVYHLEAAVRSMEQRKSQLDNLVQLWCKGYYSKPDGGPRAAGDDVSRDVRKNLNKNKGE